MILKASQRSGGRQLAKHLLNDRDNDHVTLHELRGFMADDLDGAFAEMHAVSKATACKQFMFSLSLNPPKHEACTIDDLMAAVERAEITLGLEGQPRAVVVHEKLGRRHAHAVWSRIDADDMKAVPMSFFKNRLTTLSKELYLEHGWELPDGHKENGWKNPLNFTLAEAQQAKRIDLDPREIKQIFQLAWERSDGFKSFRTALESSGYYVAKGDRRGFVATDLFGEVYSVARWVGVPTRELNQRLGTPEGLPSLDEVQQVLRSRVSDRVHGLIKDRRQQQSSELKPETDKLQEMVQGQRAERENVVRAQEERRQREARERGDCLNAGFVSGVWNFLTGRTRTIRQEIEKAAVQCHRRDLEQRERLYVEQAREREALSARIADMRQAHHREMMAFLARAAELTRMRERAERERPRREWERTLQRGP